LSETNIFIFSCGKNPIHVAEKMGVLQGLV